MGSLTIKKTNKYIGTFNWFLIILLFHHYSAELWFLVIFLQFLFVIFKLYRYSKSKNCQIFRTTSPWVRQRNYIKIDTSKTKKIALKVKLAIETNYEKTYTTSFIVLYENIFGKVLAVWPIARSGVINCQNVQLYALFG